MDEFRRRLMFQSTKVLINRDNYLTMTAKANSFQASFTNDVYYNINGYDWVLLSAGTKTPAIANGEVISFKAELMPTSSVGIGTFSMTKKCYLSGNCMSMLFGDSAELVTSLSGYSYAFYNLFNSCSYIVTVSSTFIPATTLANYCYSGMFEGCSSLTTAPKLSAKTLAANCYENMFKGCTSLKKSPSLSVTTLADSCYYGMFSGCTALTTAPTLSAKTATNSCYQSMFEGCIALTTAPTLPATTLANYCYSGMFEGCTGLTTVPNLPATLAKYRCYNRMFYGCTSITRAEYIASEIGSGSGYAYVSMFEGCAKLSYIKITFYGISASSSHFKDWVKGVASTGTFVKSPNSSFNTIGVNGIPSGWTVETT